MSLLQQMFTGDNADAMIGLGAGLLSKNPAAGFTRAQNLLMEAPYRKLQQSLLQSRVEQEQLQNEDMRRAREQQMQIDGAARNAYRSPEQANAMSMGPMPNGSAVPQVQPGFDQQQFLQSMFGINPLKALEVQKSMQPKGLEFGKVDVKDYTPESVRAAQAAGDYSQLVPVRKADVVNGQAVNLYDTKPGTVFDTNDPNKAFGLKGGQVVANAPFQQFELGKARAGASNVSVNTGQKGLDNELSLHSKWRAEPIYKAHQEVQSAHSQISAALKQQSPAGDLAGATKIMKILDPGSVVRESELGMAMAASGALDRLQHYATNVVNGTKLTPKQRADFQQLADKLYTESGNQYNNKRKEYTGFASEYGLNGERITGPAITSPKLPAPAASPGGAPSLDDLLKKYGGS